MVQLKVYDAAGSQFWLDTYKEQPIKVTLAIEDIEKVSAMSSFSRTFRVPGTKHNYQYFKTMFLVEGQDFDVTRKAKAEILVDGAQFSVGHIRVQKVFVNQSEYKYEYEITFMGETRDFAAALADKPMCQLQIPSLSHEFSQTTVESSWQAYPQNTSGTAGLEKGNVLYPLIDFGNTYPGTGANQNATGEPRIAIDHPSADGGSFDDHSHGILYNRFKPMIRAKCLIDQIFYDSNYTYTSNFLGAMEDPAVGSTDTSLFKQIYISAFGNDESIYVDPNIGSTNTFQAQGSPGDTQGDDDWLQCPVEISDPGNNYDPITFTFTAPGATNGDPITLSLAASCGVYAQQDGQYGSISSGEVRLRLYRKAWNGSNFLATIYDSNSTFDGTMTLTVQNASFNVGDEFRVFIEKLDTDESPYIFNQTFACTAASVGDFNPIAYMDCEYKQIDFVRDLITTFRLVMAPNPNKPRDFIIEPAQQYYRTGQQRDWSSKLDNQKDQVIEPLFYTQTDEIHYRHTEDEDFVNVYHRDVYKDNYGYLEFDSGNELLKGEREIKTNWAPTPITQIEGALSTSGWIIPQIHTRSAEPDGTQFLPIKAKTRWLFYNGLQQLPSGTQWYFDGQSQGNGEDYWPLVSNSSVWPMTANGTVLNWFNDIGYWGTDVPSYPTQLGQTIYETYWRNNIINTYDKYARRLTATFILDSTDLIDLQFSDTIFVNGTWYRPEKIIDYQVGEKCKVKCQLIKVIPAFAPFYSPLSCNMTLGQEAISEAAACNNTTADQSVIYQSNSNLQVGDDTNANVQGQAGGFFYVVSNDCDPTVVGKILELDNTGEVVAITDPCGSIAPVYNYDAVRCDDGTTALVVQSDLSNLLNGAVMKTDGGICVTIGNSTTSSPDEILDDSVSYATCADCLPPVTYVYEVERCDNGNTIYAESTLNTWTAGTIVKVSRNVCVEIIGTASVQPTVTMDDTQSYATCADCDPPIIPQTYNCVNGSCVDPGDGTGQYSTLSACQLACSPPSLYYYQMLTCDLNYVIVKSTSLLSVYATYYWGTDPNDPTTKGDVVQQIFDLPTDPVPTVQGLALCRIQR